MANYTDKSHNKLYVTLLFARRDDENQENIQLLLLDSKPIHEIENRLIHNKDKNYDTAISVSFLIILGKTALFEHSLPYKILQRWIWFPFLWIS